MRSRLIAGVGLLLAIIACAGHHARAQGQDTSVKRPEPAAWRLAGDTLPDPPQQTAAWEAPKTELSPKFVAAATTLFRQGLADPRGCEYREIEVLAGSFEPPWTDTVVKTHGWVLPNAAKPAGQRLAVCWNGLVYPLISVGKPADVRADACAAAATEPEGALTGTGRVWRAYSEDALFCHPWEGRAMAHDSPLPIKACLLLRLGEAKLAERIWDRWLGGIRSQSSEDPPQPGGDADVALVQRYLEDAYVPLANCWTVALRDQAVSGHLRGDDRLALAAAERLAAAWPAVEAETTKRGFPRPSAEKLAQGTPYLQIDVEEINQLLADQRQRARQRREGTVPPVLNRDYAEPVAMAAALAPAVSRCPSKAARIDLLVRELQEEWPEGGGMLRHGPRELRLENVVAAFLAGEGEECVTPLLACLQGDTRLTRSPNYLTRFPQRVVDIVDATLQEILKMPFDDVETVGQIEAEKPEPTEAELRKARTAKMLAYWAAYQGLTPAERWYRILADDRANPRHWTAAARAILQPASIPVTLDSVTDGWQNGLRRVADRRRRHGDVLRSKTNPSVRQLLARRAERFEKGYDDARERSVRDVMLGHQIDALNEQIDNLDQQNPAEKKRRKELERARDELEKQQRQVQGQPDGGDDLTSACDMALSLAEWDPAAGLPILRRLSAACRESFESADGDPSLGRLGHYPRLILARAAAGDLGALDEYAAWLRQRPSASLLSREEAADLFEPLARYPDRPAMVRTAEWLFGDPASPWHPILLREEQVIEKELTTDLLTTPLVAVPAFRRRLLELLEDQRPAGQATVKSYQRIILGVDGDREMSTMRRDPACPPPGAKVPFRICDVCAYGLSSFEGMRNCELFWTEKHRNRAVADCAATLRQYGHRFRLDDTLPTPDSLSIRYWIDSFSQESPAVRLAFAVLGRPATPEDVRRGEAIFSLAGSGPVRVAAMPKLPCVARWTALKKYPVMRETRWQAGEAKKIVSYEQQGLLWQAEEVRVAGRWQRYYGFVGAHDVARVPAEEIEFGSPQWGEIPVSDHVAISLKRASEAEERGCAVLTLEGECMPAMFLYPPGRPVVFAVQAMNLHGADRPLPDLAESAAGDRRGAAPIALALRYSPGIPPFGYFGTQEGPALFCSLVGRTWTDLPRKAPKPLASTPLGRALLPSEAVDCLHLDLAELFGPLRPGTYRLLLKLAAGKDGPPQEDEAVFAVTDQPPAP